MDSIVNLLAKESNPGQQGGKREGNLCAMPSHQGTMYYDLSPDRSLTTTVRQSTWVLATLKGPTEQELERQQRGTTGFQGYDFESQRLQEFFTR